MRTLFLLFLPSLLFTSTTIAQKFNVRNDWSLRQGAAATRSAYFLFDTVEIIRTGKTSSRVSQKALQLILDFQPEACVAYTSRKMRRHKNRELLEIRAIAYQYLFAYEKAIADYQEALALLPDDTTYQAIVHNFYELENYPKALQWAEKGLEAFPASVTLWHAYATVTQRAKPDWKASLPLYAKAAELDGTGRFYNMAGGVCWMHGESLAGVPYLSHAIAAEPENAFYYARRGSFYLEADHFDEAIADYLQAIALEPENASFWHELAQVYYFQKDGQRKQEAIRKSEKLGYGECLCIIHK